MYFRPSWYRSYAVEVRNESARPTTKPRTVRSTESTPTNPACQYHAPTSSTTSEFLQLALYFVIATIAVDQHTMKNNGIIIFGRMLPWTRKKNGSLECFDGSSGPDFTHPPKNQSAGV